VNVRDVGAQQLEQLQEEPTHPRHLLIQVVGIRTVILQQRHGHQRELEQLSHGEPLAPLAAGLRPELQHRAVPAVHPPALQERVERRRLLHARHHPPSGRNMQRASRSELGALSPRREHHGAISVLVEDGGPVAAGEEAGEVRLPDEAGCGAGLGATRRGVERVEDVAEVIARGGHAGR
jgi:hypothetical protein